MHTITSGVGFVDLEYQGTPRLIATGLLETEEGLLLVDPGPETALDTLRRALQDESASLDDVHAVLLTHIHLDHAGAAGRIVEDNPAIDVYVHERGARHLVNPRRLLRSARRIYGDAMDRLWGTVRPIPSANTVALRGGEMIMPGNRSIEVAYTPGHASHHVSYYDTATGTAFVGDTAGMRVTGSAYVLPVAPPPDIDVDAWHASLDRLRAWAPERLMLTHFGAFEDATRHLDVMDTRLDAFAKTVRTMLGKKADDADQADRFHAQQIDALRDEVPKRYWLPYEQFGQPRESWHGLARYWRTRDA
jgi:glyoxylase-like metal-dependent hydrolase (beta-lactamase superfamily II)